MRLVGNIVLASIMWVQAALSVLVVVTKGKGVFFAVLAVLVAILAIAYVVMDYKNTKAKKKQCARIIIEAPTTDVAFNVLGDAVREAAKRNGVQ